MSSTKITSGDSLAGAAIESGNDGTLVLQAGPAGSKVNAVTVGTDGSLTLLKPASAAGWPAFSAVRTGDQSLATSTWTKVTFQTPLFDLTGAYDHLSTYRFNPKVAGYYFINTSVFLSYSGTPPSIIETSLYKNGVSLHNSFHGEVYAGPYASMPLSALVYLNGTTDYIEVFARSNGSGVIVDASATSRNFFQGYLVNRA